MLTADHWQLHTLIEELHRLDDKISEDFARRRGRKPELADKIKKVIEEVGEVIHCNSGIQRAAINYKELLAEEVWDSTIAAISQGFNLGLTNTEMMEGLNRVLAKLDTRWNGHPDER